MPGMGAGVGIEQQLVRIEAVALRRLIGTVDAVAIMRPGTEIGNEAVKDLVGIFRQFDAGFAVAVEQTDLDLGRVGGE